MKRIGGYLLFFGIGSIILNLIGLEFIVLSWVDSWGATTGWEIRLGFIGAGAALLFLGSRWEGSGA